MRRIVICFAAAIAAALAVAGPAVASGTPQSPQSQTFLVSCPNFAPFLVTSPTGPSAAGVGQPMGVIPAGTFRGNMPTGLVMNCLLQPEPSGQPFTSAILIAPISH
jgi:hypothetical protein